MINRNVLVGTSFRDINSNQNKQQSNISRVFIGPTNERQRAIVDAFRHAWKGYKKYAWGHDNLKPISEGYSEWFGLGLTIVDSIDTIYIMGLREEYEEARNWIEQHLHFTNNRDVNLFEVTIRVLGGLLGIYHLTGDRMFLNKALDLGDRLLPSFASETGIPYSDINLFTRTAHPPKWSPDSSTAEVTTLQLEFRDLSRASGDPKYENAVMKISEHIHHLHKQDGLVPIFINPNSGQFRSYATITFGARGDSYYEYLLKQWLQTGKTIDFLRDDYLQAIEGVQKSLVKRTLPNGFLFLGELLAGGKDFKPKMDHLTCFLPGTLALGTHHGLPTSHLKLAEELLTTCYQTYAQQPTFLAPEITYFNIQGENSNDIYVKTNDAHNLLRPEFIESLWYLNQLYGNSTYQDWGWEIFQAFEKYTKVTNGYTSIGNVRNAAAVKPKDMMESFFLGETLKYLYLLFADDTKLLDLDKYVLNSEAHPLPVYNS
ncbi:mannosyl-oligosaccharide alpha-12-mannosidase-related [Holotrichia oblita]|uniref:Mannosyl-oligosaccharide alpha-12-mannosidase-related n=1 Tax=Holotrichia oblita TaxID=644536 RepID=A0ACB9TYP4_HOLOL|nr:mannosyl-oligosaccharide alpha-12-mannosidase-related [Holotrichia oblita]